MRKFSKRIVILTWIVIFMASCTTTPMPSYSYEEMLNPAYPGTDFMKMDSHAMKTPAEAEKDIPTLAAYLIEPADNEWEKVRGLYVWVASNISYNMAMYRGRVDYEASAVDALDTRLAICAGYANLLQSLCIEAGLECETISGYSKGLGYEEGGSVEDLLHAWNVVRIDGEWRLFDCTWSSGEVSGIATDGAYNDYWFNTNPEEFIFSHLPNNPTWQLLDDTVDIERFESWPGNVDSLFQMGITVQEFRDYYNSNEYEGLLNTYFWGIAPIIRAVIPLTPTLKPGEAYDFYILAPHFYGLAFINNGEWVFINKEDDSYTKNYRPRAGDLALVVKYNANNYRYIAKYKVTN